MIDAIIMSAPRSDDLGINRTGTVADIPDAELLRRAVKGCTQRRRPRWLVVMDTFLLGSTYAWQLCVRFNLDPEEIEQPFRSRRS